MQNNHQFLENMQAFLSNQNHMISTESDDANISNLLKSQNSQIQPTPDGEGSSKNLIFDVLSSFTSSQGITQDQQNNQPGQQIVQIDPTIQGMFDNQYVMNESISSNLMNNEDPNFLNEQDLQQNTQFQMPMMDPSMMTPEYMQMFAQFYQMFLQLQQLQQESNGDNEFMNNETFIQNLMIAFFQQMNGQQMNDAPKSPKNLRDYNINLPLAAIPESKDSILEENSGWNTAKSNKLGLLMSTSSAINKEAGCNCCNQCQEMKKRGSLQPCSLFNANNPSVIGFQILQDAQRNEALQSLRNSQVLKSSTVSNQCTPTPNTHLNRQIQQVSHLTSLDINQNLNKVFQNQGSESVAQSPNFFQLPILDSKRTSCSNEQCLSEKEFVDQFIRENPIPNSEHLMLSPQSQVRQNQQQVLSPQQIQQNKIIEYMLENDETTNFKHRREQFNTERLSRTLSKSGNKNIQAYHKAQQSVPNINTYFSQGYQQSSQQDLLLKENYNTQNIYHHQSQGSYADIQYKNNNNHFFSPQVQSKQTFFTKKSSLKDLDNNMYSPEAYQGNEIQHNQNPDNNKRKKTQEKIKEIRKINERREQIKLKKSQTRGNLRIKNNQNVFEIRDLKKSQSRKANHNRKQSYNVQANKENQKLLQSNIQHNYEMSHENIVMSPNKDLLMISQDIHQNNSRKDSNTFKSLKGIWNNRQSCYNTSEDYNALGSGVSSPVITNLRLNVDSQPKLSSITPFDNSSIQNYQLRLKQDENVNILDAQELLSDRKPGQEIHIIKKPVQTEELKKIQQRLNVYYKNKQKDEDKNKVYNQQQQQNQQYNNYDNDALSMTKTLSSFKSLMMKTMSQMSIQQDQNLQQQYINGKKARGQKGAGNQTHQNQSVNVSSIQDDISYAGDYSENFSKVISPKNLYNGSLANIKHRNYQPTTEDDKLVISPRSQIQQEQQSTSKKVTSSCLPNSLFFKQQNQNKNEETLSLKYNSRQPSFCYCGKQQCICDKNSKKDLLSHFQNFLHEMDKHPSLQGNNMMNHPSRESLMPSPIAQLGNTNTTQDFLMSNFPIMKMGRSSSQSTRFGREKSGNNRQSMINSQSHQVLNGPRIKRFSSGAQLPTIMNLQKTVAHSQSTQILEQNINLLNIDNASKSLHQIQENGLEKLDTNKEEEIRLLNQENDYMQKAFIQKSHKLNLQEQQRQELLNRIQRHKLDQRSKNNSIGPMTEVESSLQNAVGTTHNTTQSAGSDSQNQSHNIILKANYESISGSSLEERRKIAKYQKQVNNIMTQQHQREVELLQNQM